MDQAKRQGEEPTLISVILPTYNRAQWLRRALESVQAQTYPHLEILVVDDASTDDTAAVVDAVADARIHYFRHATNSGGSKARNTGLLAARGAFIAFLDDDDEWLPEKLEKQLGRFRTAPPEVGVVYAGAAKVSEQSGRIVETWVPKRTFGYVDFLSSTRFGTSVPLIRRTCFDVVGLFDETLPGTQDRDMWLRLAKHVAFAFVPDVLVRHHIHGRQITTNLPIKIEARERILKKYERDLAAHPEIMVQHLQRLGMLCCADGQWARGRRYLWKSLRQNPTAPDLYVDLLYALLAPEAYRRRLLQHDFKNVEGIPLYY